MSFDKEGKRSISSYIHIPTEGPVLQHNPIRFYAYIASDQTPTMQYTTLFIPTYHTHHQLLYWFCLPL